jgi:2OG-Fe(II) oxygenase superfamily
MDTGGDFLPLNEKPNFIDILPQGGTLVLFKSEMIPHEVLNTNLERIAVVGWYNRAVTAADITNLTGDGGKQQIMMLAVAAALVTVGLVSILG